MTTLYNALLDVARTCGVLVSGTATGGSTTSLVDTGRLEQDDYFKGGTLFIRTSSPASTKITAYSQSAHTFTFPARANIVTGTLYSASNQSRDTLVQAINLALTHMGPYTATDETLLLASNTIEYSLPTGVHNVVRVEAPIRYDPTNVSLLAYEKLYHWEEDNGKLRFKYPISGAQGSALRIYYNIYHADVNLDADVISDLYNRQRLMWTAAYFFEYQRMQFSGNSDAKETLLMQAASLKEAQMAQSFPVPSLSRDPILETYR
ncbi:MAG TPA: hypothetical protein PL124_10230 [Candidatus Cloacimonadota bacterium]|nr:hypothetical protein [Candidatus Cloacimonadota bacterium]